ncbi:hypothetical protein AVEN_24066-1 [Araneus ventricosus]|uniref:Uncharacterized protein n=1 Tax=Araneus ventricosus TaxID=182803 RepID=A0A4Y2NIT0_ARAVE|nr:hypothetical protein AVEN_24066-1 [Araneus ventricosus]
MLPNSLAESVWCFFLPFSIKSIALAFKDCEQVHCEAYHHESITVNQVINGGESRGEKTRICRLRLQNSNKEKGGCSHLQGDQKRRNNTVLRKSE